MTIANVEQRSGVLVSRKGTTPRQSERANGVCFHCLCGTLPVDVPVVGQNPLCHYFGVCSVLHLYHLR